MIKAIIWPLASAFELIGCALGADKSSSVTGVLELKVCAGKCMLPLGIRTEPPLAALMTARAFCNATVGAGDDRKPSVGEADGGGTAWGVHTVDFTFPLLHAAVSPSTAEAIKSFTVYTPSARARRACVHLTLVSIPTKSIHSSTNQ
jgi:hypothetical protein